ncbi:hypothetical protein IWX90DRAFT_76149 [Phyllosticta citrichinensis]|uniref:Uncharacterized protein n=1 Tax=Phyllosticta citrichinensis TaxID=1130410 RepID=A0ABR1XGJ0_9PEZI
MSTPTTNRRVLLDTSKPDRHATTPSKTPGRRVLGELASNANITPQKSTITSGKTQAPLSPSPRKPSRTFTTIQDENKHDNLQEAHLKSRKRSIHEVEGALARQDAIGSPAKRVAGRADLTKISRPPIHVRPDSTATASTMPAIDLQPASPAKGSPEPTPQNTQETVGNKSFSSLIDYTAAASPKLQTSSPPEPAETRVKTQAETLRLRLRAALYKVKTDQIFIPLGNLEIPEQYQRRAQATDVASTGQQTPPQSQPEPNTTETVTRDSGDSSSTALKLLPAPLLRPTAYSTRFIETPHLPSSPPATALDNDDDATPRPTTPPHAADPTTPIARHASVPAQLSSPPGSGSVDDDDAAAAEAKGAATEGELTSSVRKGRAASGLLELMRST